MRLSLVCVALLVALSGCSVGYTPVTPADDATPTPDGEPTPTATATETPTPTPTATETPEDEVVRPPDPDSDRLGWEDGRWANETLRLNRSDGLNESEQEALVARTMARVEVIRQLEFERTVPVRVMSREAYANNTSQGANYSESFRQFDNAKFEAMFLVGEDNGSIAIQNTNRGQSVLGFYDPRTEEIVLVAENGTASIDRETVLAHELAHALQDQQFNLSSIERRTREQYAAANGIIEGDAHYVEGRYEERCGEEWDCITSQSSGGGGGGDFHLGIYVLSFFPYSDGPPFVDYHHERGNWSRINAMYQDPPASSEQVIHPEKYGEDAPTAVSLADRNRNGWERVRPAPARAGQSRPNYARLGQASLSTMFIYTLYDDYNPGAVIRPGDFLNRDAGGAINRTDPFNYALNATDGWDGDRMHVYRNDGELAYVWKITWDSPGEAREFAAAYEELLNHWGGTRSGGETFPRTYRVSDSPFADSFRVHLQGDTVVIVNAPTEGSLDDVWRPGDAG